MVVAQKGFVQFAALALFNDVDFGRAARQFLQRIAACVPHGGGQSHGRWHEGLHLVEAEVVFLQPQRQIHHVFV